MKKTKKKMYNVECAINPEHVFEKVYSVKELTDHKVSEMEVYCPICDAYTNVTIKGKVVPDTSMLRRFDIS